MNSVCAARTVKPFAKYTAHPRQQIKRVRFMWQARDDAATIRGLQAWGEMCNLSITLGVVNAGRDAGRDGWIDGAARCDLNEFTYCFVHY